MSNENRSKIFSIFLVIKKVSNLLSKRQKFLLIFLIALSIGFSIIETIGVSAIMPFISLASDPSIAESGYYKMVYDYLGFSSVNSFIIILGIGIICFYIFRSIYHIFHVWAIHKYSHSIHEYLSLKLFKKYLYLPYKSFSKENTAIIMHSINGETGEVSKIIIYLLQLFTEFVTILAIYILLIFVNWTMTLILTFAILFIVIILLLIVTKVNREQGKKRTFASRLLGRILKENLSNFKFVKLKGNEKEIFSQYNNTMKTIKKTNIIHHVLGALPKGILECIGFSFLICMVIYSISKDNSATLIIPVITMYALALYRILPALQRLLREINGIAFHEFVLDNVYNNLQQSLEKEYFEPVEFKNSIKLENISFNYIKDKDVLKNISLEIKKGEKIAFTGESGGGKSTLIDIIIGINKPDSGKLSVDNTEINDNNIRAWRKKIGYIPQSIYLFDGTVAENVSFGSEYNEEKVVSALKKANVWDFLCTKEGINTKVGDGGIQLSGGQQQRIGIARALYDDPEVLVLDEATSALDNETEAKIMNEIYSVSENKTLLVIAHRLTTVERCERRIVIENGRVK